MTDKSLIRGQIPKNLSYELSLDPHEIRGKLLSLRGDELTGGVIWRTVLGGWVRIEGKFKDDTFSLKLKQEKLVNPERIEILGTIEKSDGGTTVKLSVSDTFSPRMSC